MFLYGDPGAYYGSGVYGGAGTKWCCQDEQAPAYTKQLESPDVACNANDDTNDDSAETI